MSFTESLEPNKAEHLFQPIANDTSETFDFLGQCYRNLGMEAEARAAWEHCLKLEKKIKTRDPDKVRIAALEKMLEESKFKIPG